MQITLQGYGTAIENFNQPETDKPKHLSYPPT